MLACTAMLVGCTSDDVIDNGQDNNKQSELVRGDAYVNFVINTKTDSSRGTIGDGDPDADDNKHHVNGVRTENKVNNILVVIAKAVEGTSKEEPQLYTSTMVEGTTPVNDKVANGYVGYFSSNELTPSNENADNNTVYTLANPIRLDYTGDYAVLVVINPVKELREKIKEGSDHKLAYEEILKFEGNAYEGEGENQLFQMSNKEACVITATAKNNVPNNPVVAPIAVERTVSKATWRWQPADSSFPGELGSMQNVYPVDVNVNVNKTKLGSFWYKKVEKDNDGKDYDTYYYSKVFNEAKDVNGETYWVLFKKNYSGELYTEGGQVKKEAIEAIFKGQESYTLYKGVTDVQDDDAESLVGQEVEANLFNQTYAQATENVKDDLVNNLTFVYTSTSQPGVKYYVKLTHFAFTNLTRSVYAVRHISKDNTFADNSIRKLGVLATNEYLVTPYTVNINKGTAVSFNNTLSQVNNAAKSLSYNANGELVGDGKDTFMPLPTSGDDGVANTGHYKGENESNNVGYLMDYFNENSSLESVQNPANITGVVFVGQVYDNNGKIVPVLYKYNQKYYRTLQALVDGCGTDGILSIEKEGTTYKITPNSTDSQASAAGIDVYPSGRCFYYTTEIKHLDNGVVEGKDENGNNTGFGPMEFAIMRNNIYSLRVTKIQGIGDATLNITENTPISDIRSYLKLEVSILPWIVRFNDIEF